MRRLSFLVLFFLNLVEAQGQGIQFESGTWEQIKAKAKAENKYIFMDAFTTWCFPCKTMSTNVFPLPEVGQFYNKNFLNVAVQMDKTKKDSKNTRKWYKDAHDIGERYQVRSFPAFLFFNPEGELVHRIVGATDASAFIERGRDALVPAKQYYTLKKRYEKGENHPEFLLQLATAAKSVSENIFSEKLIKEYLSTQKDLFTFDNLQLLIEVTKKSSDPGFRMFKDEFRRVDSLLGTGRSVEIIKGIAKAEVEAIIYNKGIREEVDWMPAERKLKFDYADIEKEVIFSVKAAHYERFKNWKMFTRTVSDFLFIDKSNIDSYVLNDFLYSVFKNCDDITYIKEALAWSTLLLAPNPSHPTFLNTYANLLYKSGSKEEAIKVKERVIELDINNQEYLEATLERMKRGEEIWQ